MIGVALYMLFKFSSVPIYMIQRLQDYDDLTRDTIEQDRLNECKLAFWYCTLKDGQYTVISPSTYSGVIKRSKTFSAVLMEIT